jgi:hypothetical protein
MIIHSNVKKLLPTAFFSFLFPALGIAAAVYIFGVDMPLGPKIFGMAICTLPLTPVVFLFLRTIKRIRNDQPEIIIDDEGIYIWQWADKKVGWNNIADIRQHGSERARIFSLKLYEPDIDPPRKRKARFFDLNRDMLDKVHGKVQDPKAKFAVAALSPAAAISLHVAQGMPDHRDPIFHAHGTDVTTAQLMEALREYWQRSQAKFGSRII